MNNEWFTLILLALVAALLPWQFSAEILLLRKERGLRKATAFVGGITLWRILLGILAAFVFAGGLVVLRNGFEAIGTFGLSEFELGIERTRSWQEPIRGVLLILCGILLLLHAIRSWLGVPDPDAPPPEILARLDSISVRAAFAVGMLWIAISVTQWAFLIAGVSQILALQGGSTVKLMALVLFLVVGSLLILTPIALYAAQPTRAQARLAVLDEKLKTGMRYFGIFLQGGIGLIFAWRGFLLLAG